MYNGARELGLIFLALDRQSFRDFEVIVADDGSGPEVAGVVESRSRDAEYRVTHLWQPDAGFRKNVMLNRAIVASGTPYLVFIDHDCIPHRHFLADHWDHRGERDVLCGRRVNLGPEMSARVTPDRVRDGSFERLSAALLLDGLRGRSAYIEEALRTTNPLLRKLLHPRKAGILGSNFSVHRDMLERINGFNEDYTSYGLEDSDLAFRLGLAGGALRSLRNLAVLFHLYHTPKQEGSENQVLYDRVVSARQMVCPNGIRKYERHLHAS